MRRLLCLLVLALVTACSSPPAPVVDRSTGSGQAALERSGHYRVRSGDTLYTIAFRYGLDHRDLAHWNAIRAPFVIYPDQLLRMSPPRETDRTASPGSQTRVSKSTASKSPASKPAVPPRPSARTPAESQGKTTAGSSTGNPVSSRPSPAKTANRPVTTKGNPSSWIWPVEGRLLRGFLANDPSRNGLDIAGQEGQSVKASAAGSVVYSGNGLIGFGELIIIKHSDSLLSAYAHNRVRLVQEGAEVEAGQKIAELGRNDRNEAILHFEIRLNGRPVDPRSYLPKR